MSENKSFSKFVENIEKFATVKKAFKNFLKKFDLTNISIDELNYIHYHLTQYLSNPYATIPIAKHFPQELLCLLSIAVDLDNSDLSTDRHLRNCCLLAQLINIHPDVESFALKYFDKYPSPFTSLNENLLVKKKKITSLQDVYMSNLTIIGSTHIFLKKQTELFKRLWDWSEFMEKYSNHPAFPIRWLYCRCLGLVTDMSEATLMKFMATKLSQDRIHLFAYTSFDVLNIPNLKSVNITDYDFTRGNKVTSVTNVNGIYLPVYSQRQNIDRINLVEVDSTKENLKKIAIGILSKKRINLVGPVGSGKTVLVEYLASKTGRVLGEDFIKIQLGDQTDSKLLLGTYRCTDIPGEFVWQPGVLTQAVLDGSWLLLEDIDSASLDIASLLSSLLENGYLTVPGFRDYVPIKEGFQLFVTQRLLPGVSGYHKSTTPATNLLEKHLMNINIEPLSFTELEFIITSLHPSLNTITSRIGRIFKYLMENVNMNLNSTDRNSRYITTRDLFKWCLRAVVDYDVSSSTSGLKLLQDALDVYCYSYSNLDERYKLGKAVCSELGIITEKVDYFFKQYKPSLDLSGQKLTCGRACLNIFDKVVDRAKNFCFTRMASCLLERVMCCISANEPVLLVGETGTGKTSTIQFLAKTLGQKLIVINMNQQSDSTDLLGGFKPTEMKFIIKPIKNEFENLFHSFYVASENEKFLGHINYCFNKERFEDLLKLMKTSCGAALKRLNKPERKVEIGKKRKTLQGNKEKFNSEMLDKWNAFSMKLEKLNQQLKHKNALAFTFVEGSLVQAIEKGYWVLLDEINLASVETLDCLSGLLEGKHSSISLLERGDKKPIGRHENFLLFACMNPSTDVGKRNLPAGLRNRFTELFVDELTDEKDLSMLVNDYLPSISSSNKSENIVKFYMKVRKEAQISLCDGLGHKPHFSLRSLCRALMIASKNPCGTVVRSLYEAFCMSFLTQLDLDSYKAVEAMIAKYMVGTEKQLKSVLKQPIPNPNSKKDEEFLQFEGYWVSKGDLEPEVMENYILTPSVRKNLKDLTRIVSIGQLPVLLQGDTSVGKTSLIAYLAKSSGNKCVRINNHEHTDLQEYIGSYVADIKGKLVFREGVLVEAMRKGHWIILDELNLAPSDVLEALNRVLDDNRELFIPETQQVVKAHPKFMLFATQNPPGTYGGRKMLSRAFRNRFVELHFNEIPAVELETILQQRCLLAPSYAKKIINVMKDLQIRRRGSAAFAGKYGFITLRDLFRWGDRYRLAEKSVKLYDWDQHLADEGYLVLAGKVRKLEEKQEIIDVLKKHLKRDVAPESLFTLSQKTSTVTKNILEKLFENKEKYPNIVWTYNMRQMAVLVSKALQFSEPVLIVGETGCGKTTICDVIAQNNGQKLVTINCHMHTESSDFIGGLRPVREHNDEDINRLFEWIDGPLIEAMREGHLFLTDEISLADDSVLERMNSLLEPERSLLLAEKGIDLNNQSNSELITANPHFHFIGTMNPGGDYGKKELSPALRNRFTEIWSEPCTNRNDFVDIINHNIKTNVLNCSNVTFGELIMDFMDWFRNQEVAKQYLLTIRDVLTWVSFINACSNKITIYDLYINGADITILDGIGSGLLNIEGKYAIDAIKMKSKNFMLQTLQKYKIPKSLTPMETDNQDDFRIGPFSIKMGVHSIPESKFSFTAPTTSYNALRVARGMQLKKPILLEGSPGVGKTSLVIALANASGNKLYRVNLSDQTDISDLFGADLPVEGGKSGQFSWRDGPLLQALKNGDWILLDELNLASQSVLEGLNACFDHRGEIFIPELGKTFYVQPGTKFFACQNPIKQGGSRRGLPKSFLNRFTQVYIESLTSDDYIQILHTQFDQIPKNLIEKMVKFNTELVKELSIYSFGHLGGPWEYNLRDLTRWCEIIIKDHEATNHFLPEKFLRLVYTSRLRKIEDRDAVCQIFEKVFDQKLYQENAGVYVTVDKVFIGDTSIARETKFSSSRSLEKDSKLLVLRNQMKLLRNLCHCVNMNWLAIVVGSSGCGKSSIVRTLAGLAGKTLHTLPVTSAMDTSDLLGGFEQTDYGRHLEDLNKQTESVLSRAIHSALLSRDDASASKLLKALERCRNGRDSSSEVTEKRTMAEETELFLTKIEVLATLWNQIGKSSDLEGEVAELREKGNLLRSFVESEGSLNAGGKFEWVDSILIKSLLNGHWLLVDNVNLCSPAVLDRLNGLLEPNGVLTISERGIDSNGKMIEIKPHKDFRLFFTMNPKNGEISRAMRNRGIEVYVLPDDVQTSNCLDLKSLICSNGVRDTNNIEALIQIHEFISDLIVGEKPNTIHILQTAFLISQQINRGIDTEQAVITAVMDIYYKTKADYEFNANDPENTIKSKIRESLNGNKEVGIFNHSCTLNIEDLNFDSTVMKIKQQIAGFDEYSKLNKKPDLTSYCLLNHIYSVSSANDLEWKYYHLKMYIGKDHEIFDELNNKFYNALKIISGVECPCLPFDKRWLSNQQSNNNAFLLLYFLTIKSIAEVKIVEKFSILNYIEKIKQNTFSDNINDVVIKEITELLKQFDDYLITNLSRNVNVEVSDEHCIEIISSLQWRKYIYLQLQNRIEKINETDLNDVLLRLHVHYKWFAKHCASKIINSLNIEGNEIKAIVNRINSQLTTHFSGAQKIGKRYRKSLLFPPPIVSENQLNAALNYDKIDAVFDFYKTSGDTAKILRVFSANKDIYYKLSELKYKLKTDGNFGSTEQDELKSLRDLLKKIVLEEYEEDGNVSEMRFITLIDYFALLNVYKSKATEEYEIIDAITVPYKLNGILKRYLESKDERFIHEVNSFSTYYLLNALCTTPNRIVNNEMEKVEVKLNLYTPILTYLLTNFLIDENCSIEVKFGDYRNSYGLYNKFNVILWNYFDTISKGVYDFMEMECNYVLKCCQKFIKEFGNSLGINVSTSDYKMIVKNCIEEIENAYSKKDKKSDNEIELIIELIQKCYESMQIIPEAKDSVEKLNSIGDLFVYLNYLKAILNSKLLPIDPQIKREVKRKYLQNEIEDFSRITYSFEYQNRIYTNDDFSLNPSLRQKKGQLERKYEGLKEYLAVRPKAQPYKGITQDIRHAFSTVLSGRNILEYTAKINNSIADVKEASFAATGVSSNIESFCKVLCKYTSTYPDVVEPLYGNLLEMLRGIRLKENLAKKVSRLCKARRHGLDVDGISTNLISFPNLNETQSSFVEVTNLYLDDNLLNLDRTKLFKYLKCALLEVYNFAIISSKYLLITDKSLINQFEIILNKFIDIWNKQQEIAEKERSESQTLYKFKSNKTEEEQIQEEFDELFPTFHDEDFEEYQKNSLDYVRNERPITIKEDTIKIEDVQYVYKLHKKLMEVYTKTPWIEPKVSDDNYDHVTPLIEKYKLFKIVLNEFIHCLDYNVDKRLLGSLAVLINVAKNFGNSQLLSKSRESYNFYHDSNIEEIKNCYHILRELEMEIKKYLEEWPEHPTLQDINIIIARIYSFDVNSPVSRFLTGFEILLTKCHEWEQNAHSGVSLQTSISRVTEQIICWRKMELYMWKSSLNITYDRMNLKIAKWWSYLYNVINQFHNCLMSESDFIDSLQKFMNQSNLAEFKNRLELFKLFHCYCVHLDKSEKLKNSLWNAYNYYLQFLPNVISKIRDFRNPIEQKLKNYVKIVRWKDISYWAVKDTLIKTHKTIHKHMREFEKILQQPVQPFLILPIEKTNHQIGIWDKVGEETKIININIYISNMSTLPQNIENLSENSLLKKSSKYFTKSKSLSEKIMSSIEHQTLIENLDEFISEVIKTSAHLQNLEVDKTLPESKQKSQAKSILQQKRRGLIDLFKNLAKIGLSHKKGVLESNLANELRKYLIKPIDLEVMLKNCMSHERVVDETTLKAWSGSETHFTKSLIKLDVLQNILINPSKDLGPSEIERCKGFPVNLMNNIYEQKEKLVNSFEDFLQLRKSIKYFNEYSGARSFVESNSLKNLINALKKAVVILNEYKIVLNSCPDKSDFDMNLNEIPLLKNVDNSLCYKNQEVCDKAVSILHQTLDEIEVIFNGKILKEIIENLDGLHIKYIPLNDLDEFLGYIKNVLKLMNDLSEVFGKIPLSDSLNWIRKCISNYQSKLKTKTTQAESNLIDMNRFIKRNENLISKILIAIQDLFKNIECVDPRTENQTEEFLRNNHLNITTEGINKSLSLLNTKEIIKIIIKIKKDLQELTPNQLETHKETLKTTLPLLNQFCLLYQFFFTHQVACYRTSSKMNSIILNIFTDLMTKGFCIPPEFSDESCSEGCSQQTSGMGLGDGEGEKDVSDRIESEDQLEDAKPDGQQDDKTEEDKDCKEEKGGIEMSEDFDSKHQDVEKNDDAEENDDSDGDSDAEEQMGETETGADQLDKEVWGSDNEEEKEGEGEGKSKEEEKGKGGEDLNEDQIGAKEEESKEKDSSRKQPQDVPMDKDFNEDIDDDQVDPYHQNQQEMPEPEPMDLPDDLQVDEGEEKDEENPEENPFDIDEMKDKIPEVTEEESNKTQNEEEKDKGDINNESDPDIIEISDDENEPPQQIDDNEEQQNNKEDTNQETNDSENLENLGSENLDQNNTQTDDQQQPMDVDNSEIQSSDKIASNEATGQNTQDTSETTEQNDKNDASEGQGQCQKEQSEGGHRDTSISQQMSEVNEQRNQDSAKRMGESDSNRSLGDTNEPVKKKLKTIHTDNNKEDGDENSEERKNDSDMYQHVKESKKHMDQVLDAATKEQVEEQKIAHDDQEEKNDDNQQSADDVPVEVESEEDVNVSETPKEKSQNLGEQEKDKNKKAQHPEGNVLQDLENAEMEIEGEIVKTSQVPRGNESFFNQTTGEKSNEKLHIPHEDMMNLRQQIEQELSTWVQPPTTEAAQRTWDEISAVTSSLAHHLAEQLRLVLEPTQASRLKGDFKTGKRINMRKIIPYVASQFRKDKIWLRRTKPAKREYQIVLAIDDSSSMADNHSKELAFESVALMSRALGLLESGELAVLSFGENTEILHRLSDPFTEKSGASLLQKFQFSEKKTCVGQMLNFATEMLNSNPAKSNILNAKLLVVVSDGRGIFSEGETFVHTAIRNARLSNVFTIFIIVDNPENNSTILDIRRAVFNADDSIEVQSYMDSFPFPFYIVLRDINSLPSVLSDALRQWFEMVSNTN